MAKKRFSITPKLNEDKEKKQIKPLPVQKISVADIEKIAIGEKKVEKKEIKSAPKAQATPTVKKVVKKKEQVISKEKKKPQGRPRRTEPIKRLSSDLPADLYDMVKDEVKDNGYTLNGFLTKVLRTYFKNKKDT